MQFVAYFADPRYQLLLDEVVHILGLFVFDRTLRSCCHLANLLQALKNADEFVGRQNAGVLQGASVSAARSQFVMKQPSIEVKRPLPAFELRVQRLPEPARPHLHRATSTRPRARTREGNPRMRMNPAASFWS